ncbi:MAG: hypothetical protein Q4C80_00830 [Bacillota bacterium]|nr:hypothetical protein [Bacillota bacterium]
MNYYFDNTKTTSSKIIQEEYFPVIIEFSSEELNNKFLEFNYTDTDMFEVSVNPETYEIKRFSLTLCNHYSFVDAIMVLPTYEEGILHITGPTTTECSLFNANVYKDGLEIRISSELASRYLKSGQLIFALTENNKLTSVFITELTPNNIDHVKTELTF